MKKILENKLYIKTLIADIVSNFGDILYYLALLNYVLQIENSNVAIAIINISEIIPILLAFLIGYKADQNIKQVSSIIGTLVFRCLLYVIVAALVGLEPSLMSVVIISIINFFSDLAGQYENGLYYSITSHMVDDDVREDVMAFRQSVIMSLTVFFQAVGGILICYITFRNLALINACTFFVSILIIGSAKRELLRFCRINENIAMENRKNKEQKIGSIVRKLGKELTVAIKELWMIPDIKETITIIPFLNAGLAVITPLTVFCMAQKADFYLINAEITVSALAVSESVGRIVGSALTIRLLKKVRLLDVLRLTVLTVALLFVGMFMQKIYIVLLTLFVANLLTGCIDPKMGAIIFNHLDENRLATTFGGMTTYFQVGDIVSKGFFSFLILFLRDKIIIVIYFTIMAITFLFLLFKRKCEREDQYHKNAD